MSEQQSTITKKTKGEGFKWGQELLKAKAIISDQQATIDVLEGDVSALTKIIANYEERMEDGEFVPSENVLCSYDEINDYIWGRLQDICHDEPELNDHFDWNDLIRGFKGIPELMKENEQLKQEIENLKTELKGDDARMDKIAEGYELQLRKKNAEIGVLKRKLASASPSGWVED